ncbi:MAG: hypothetical protein FRX49_09513 [Trebouxia sp. A1-2]|nr:MAG: hypothetical protein FRX49_09513 [Trebouxia sp. A1-2]
MAFTQTSASGEETAPQQHDSAKCQKADKESKGSLIQTSSISSMASSQVSASSPSSASSTRNPSSLP